MASEEGILTTGTEPNPDVEGVAQDTAELIGKAGGDAIETDTTATAVEGDDIVQVNEEEMILSYEATSRPSDVPNTSVFLDEEEEQIKN